MVKATVRGKKQMYFTAICGYPDKKAFAFFNVDFVIEDWADLEIEGQTRVVEAWSNISPYPAPEIIKFEPGSIVYVPNDV